MIRVSHMHHNAAKSLANAGDGVSGKKLFGGFESLFSPIEGVLRGVEKGALWNTCQSASSGGGRKFVQENWDAELKRG